MDAGGAFKGALNLHQGLREIGVESRILAREQALNVIEGQAWDPDPPGKKILRETSLKKIWSNRTPLSNTHFSLDFLGVDVSQHPWVQEADVIHLHWVAEFLSSRSLGQLAGLGKPIFWTLHDLRPLTGGCHYSADCGQFQSGCDMCPQLVRNRPPITRHAWKALRAAIAAADPDWIGPSRWICQQAVAAGVAPTERIHFLPYGVEPIPGAGACQREARRALGIPEDRKYVLLAASYLQEKRKGLALARGILEGTAAEGVPPGSTVLLVGNLPEVPQFVGWQTLSLGQVKPEKMALVYRAADLLLFTSLEDNLPFVLMESLQHGLLPVATKVGGVPDLLPPDQFSELIFDPEKPKEAKDKLRQLLSSDRFESLLTEVRKIGKSLPGLKTQAEAHAELYKDRTQKTKGSRSQAPKKEWPEGGILSFPWTYWWIRLKKSKVLGGIFHLLHHLRN